MFVPNPPPELIKRYTIVNRTREKMLRMDTLRARARYLNPHVYLYRENNQFPMGVTEFLPKSKAQTGGMEALMALPLYDYQEAAIKEMMGRNHLAGLLVSPTGSGKTAMICRLISMHNMGTLILVKNLNLIKQMQDALTRFLPWTDGMVGFWGDGKKEKKPITICTQAGFIRDGKEFHGQYGLLIIDEADTFMGNATLDQLIPFPCIRQFAFTATPWTDSYEEADLELVFGPITRAKYDSILPRIVALHYDSPKEFHVDWQEKRASIEADLKRFGYQIREVLKASKQCKHLLVLYDRVDTVTRMAHEYPGWYWIIGDKTSEERDEAIVNFKKHGGVLFATEPTTGRGFDLPAIDGVMLMFPNKFDARVQQMVGRALRKLEGKNQPIIFDWVDSQIKYQYRVRRKVYAKLWPGLVVEERRVGIESEGFASLPRS